MKYFIEHKDGFIIALHVNTLRDDLLEIHEQDVPLVQEYIKHNPNAPIKQELGQIKQWLNANDYKVNKHLLGEYADDDARWTTYLQERADKLARYNELEGQHIDKEPFDLTLLTPLVVESEVESEELDIIDVEEEVYDVSYEELQEAAHIPTAEEIEETQEETQEETIDEDELFI